MAKIISVEVSRSPWTWGFSQPTFLDSVWVGHLKEVRDWMMVIGHRLSVVGITDH
jgi:hypothetical protein